MHKASEEITLLALEPAQEQAALVPWNPAEGEEPLEVRLQPAVHVSGGYRTDEGDLPIVVEYLYPPRAPRPWAATASLGPALRASPPAAAHCPDLFLNTIVNLWS